MTLYPRHFLHVQFQCHVRDESGSGDLERSTKNSPYWAPRNHKLRIDSLELRCQVDKTTHIVLSTHFCPRITTTKVDGKCCFENKRSRPQGQWASREGAQHRAVSAQLPPVAVPELPVLRLAPRVHFSFCGQGQAVLSSWVHSYFLDEHVLNGLQERRGGHGLCPSSAQPAAGTIPSGVELRQREQQRCQVVSGDGLVWMKSHPCSRHFYHRGIKLKIKHHRNV